MSKYPNVGVRDGGFNRLACNFFLGGGLNTKAFFLSAAQTSNDSEASLQWPEHHWSAPYAPSHFFQATSRRSSSPQLSPSSISPPRLLPLYLSHTHIPPPKRALSRLVHLIRHALSVAKRTSPVASLPSAAPGRASPRPSPNTSSLAPSVTLRPAKSSKPIPTTGYGASSTPTRPPCPRRKKSLRTGAPGRMRS